LNTNKNSAGDVKKVMQILISKQSHLNESPMLIKELHGNDKKILSLLSKEDTSHYSFTGMKRKLNVHQQSLTRALARLEDLGFIEKSSAGYKLNKNGEITEMLADSINSITSICPRNVTSLLLHARIPVRIDIQKILIGLRGKWFDKYRFIGSKSISNGYVLRWLNEDGSFELILTIVGNYCIIDTNAASEELKLDAMLGASRLTKEITRIVQRRLHDFMISPIGNNHIGLAQQMN
jgi:DNA-binding HxlR family transcriptional regulator